MSFAKALQHFKKIDPILYEVGLKLKNLQEIVSAKPEKYFEDLCEAIVGQQLSGKVADVIWGRVLSHLKTISPEKILLVADQDLRDCGLSFAKISYIKDLASKNIDFTDFPTLSDNAIANRLIEVKGIGPWTAEMFLIFTLGRPDVFSEGDLGLKNAMKKLKGLKKPEVWSPYKSYASRILWKSLDLDV